MVFVAFFPQANRNSQGNRTHAGCAFLRPRFVIDRIADHPVNRVAELLPWAVADQISSTDAPLAAAAAA